MDYCNTVLAGAPRTSVTDKLPRALNAAARVITGTRKFDRGLGQILHDQLHWLDVPDRVLFKLAVTVHQCLNGRAPSYRLCRSTASRSDTRRHLRSAAAYFYKLEAPPPLPATIRRRAADALSVTKFFFLPLKWLSRILATFRNNYMPPFLVWKYRLALAPVFSPILI